MDFSASLRTVARAYFYYYYSDAEGVALKRMAVSCSVEDLSSEKFQSCACLCSHLFHSFEKIFISLLYVADIGAVWWPSYFSPYLPMVKFIVYI